MKTKIETSDYIAIAAVIICIILFIHYLSCGIFTTEINMKLLIITFAFSISISKVKKFIKHFQNV
jgi:hypothetical protein